MVYLVYAKFRTNFGKNYILRQILIAVNGQIVKIISSTGHTALCKHKQKYPTRFVKVWLDNFREYSDL